MFFMRFPGLAAALCTAGDVPRPAQMFRALLKHLQCAEPPVQQLPPSPSLCHPLNAGKEPLTLQIPLMLPTESHRGWREIFPWSQSRNILACAPRSSLVSVPVTHLKHS